MAYSAGKLRLYTDYETAYADYTNETFDSMTDPAVEQLCDIFGMVVFTDLTMTTARGKRYFIGFEDAEYPSYAIGWAVNSTYSNTYYLLCILLYEGEYLDNGLDLVTSSYYQNNQFRNILLTKNFNTPTYYNFINYIKDDNIKAISYGFTGSAITTYSDDILSNFVLNINDAPFVCYRNSETIYSYEYLDDGRQAIICPADIRFINIKRYIANGDLEYICQLRMDHNETINGLYIYSKVLVRNKIYYINGEYYFCIKTHSNDGSYMMKIDYTP